MNNDTQDKIDPAGQLRSGDEKLFGTALSTRRGLQPPTKPNLQQQVIEAPEEAEPITMQELWSTMVLAQRASEELDSCKERGALSPQDTSVEPVSDAGPVEAPRSMHSTCLQGPLAAGLCRPAKGISRRSRRTTMTRSPTKLAEAEVLAHQITGPKIGLRTSRNSCPTHLTAPRQCSSRSPSSVTAWRKPQRSDRSSIWSLSL